MSTYATVDDYLKRTGRTALSQAKRDQVETLLGDASVLIRSKLPKTGYEPDPELAKSICVTAVIRRLVNPGGRRSKTVGGVAETYDQDGGLYLTDDEVDQLLAGSETEGASSAYTVGVRDDAYPPSPFYGAYGPYGDGW